MVDPATGDRAGPIARPRASAITVCWWLSWVLSALLVIVTLARGLGGSLQAIADTVELHIAVDLVAAVVAGLGAAMLIRFRRLLSPPKNEFANWIVQPPAPTRPLPNEAVRCRRNRCPLDRSPTRSAG